MLWRILAWARPLSASRAAVSALSPCAPWGAPQISAPAQYSAAAGRGSGADGGPKDALSAFLQGALNETRPKQRARASIGPPPDALMRELKRTHDITSLHQVMAANSKRLKPEHLRECWLRLTQYATVPKQSLDATLRAIEVFFVLQPYLCEITRDSQSIKHVAWDYEALTSVSTTINSVLSRGYEGRGFHAAACAGQIPHVPSEMYIRYERLMRQVTEVCEARMAAEPLPDLARTFSTQVGASCTPIFKYCLQPFVRIRSRMGLDVATMQHICEALLLAMGQHTGAWTAQPTHFAHSCPRPQLQGRTYKHATYTSAACLVPALLSTRTKWQRIPYVACFCRRDLLCVQ